MQICGSEAIENFERSRATVSETTASDRKRHFGKKQLELLCGWVVVNMIDYSNLVAPLGSVDILFYASLSFFLTAYLQGVTILHIFCQKGDHFGIYPINCGWCIVFNPRAKRITPEGSRGAAPRRAAAS